METRGFSYLGDKRLKILFERHIFHKRTGGRFSAIYPDISNPKPGGYSGGGAEYNRLARAMSLDRTAAVESTSWGLGQVMGFNAASLGYDDAEDMVEKFMSGEDAQLDGCTRFIDKNPPLRTAFRAHNWARIAFFYNGLNYAQNAYNTKLGDAYAAYVVNPPDVTVRANQARLAYAGFDPKDIDGVVGQATRAAVIAFQASKGLPQTGQLDAATTSALRATARL